MTSERISELAESRRFWVESAREWAAMARNAAASTTPAVAQMKSEYNTRSRSCYREASRILARIEEALNR